MRLARWAASRVSLLRRESVADWIPAAGRHLSRPGIEARSPLVAGLTKAST